MKFTNFHIAQNTAHRLNLTNLAHRILFSANLRLVSLGQSVTMEEKTLQLYICLNIKKYNNLYNIELFPIVLARILKMGKNRK